MLTPTYISRHKNGGICFGKFAAATVIALFAFGCSAALADLAPTADSALAFEQNLSKALVDNDPDALARLLASDWVVISARGSIANRDGVIDAVRKRLWVHTTVDVSEPRVRIYGNTAVVTYRLKNAGILGGKSFNVHERETDVLVWDGSVWKAVLSHESFLNE